MAMVNVVQANWLGPKASRHLALFCIHQINHVNSYRNCVIMTGW